MGNLTTVVRFGAALLPYLVDYVVGTNDTLKGNFFILKLSLYSSESITII